MIYIKYLPKEVILYELWRKARPSRYFYHCKDLVPDLTITIAKSDISQMFINSRRIDLTTYYGRMLFVDLTDDYFDEFQYDLYNGYDAAKNIINKIKLDELKRSILMYEKA